VSQVIAKVLKQKLSAFAVPSEGGNFIHDHFYAFQALCAPTAAAAG
jgi:hypothetical protein